jgi:hypothetical protein
MVDYAATRARSEGALLPPYGQLGLAEATVARAMVSSPPPTTGEVDRLYHQLTEIHAISATQVVECTCCRHSNPTPSQVWARVGRWGPDETPSATRRASPLPNSFVSQVLLR